MCKVSDLMIMVVDADENELKKSCDSLNRMGINKIVCVESFQEAVEFLESDKGIDIVLADYAIEEGKDLGMLLVSVIKKQYPGMLVVLTSKVYSCSIVLDSIRINADDILDKNRETDIEDLMGKWIALAQIYNETREVLNGTRKKVL